MSANQFSRTELLIGKQGIEKLQKAKVAVFGIGGVGSYTVEGLARAGVGHLILVDYDTYDITNINRQLGALHSTIGKYKVEVMKERVLDINPNAIVETYRPDEIDGGEYLFKDVLIDELDNYYIEFEYNGFIYQSVPVNITVNNGSKWLKQRIGVHNILRCRPRVFSQFIKINVLAHKGTRFYRINKFIY